MPRNSLPASNVPADIAYRAAGRNDCGNPCFALAAVVRAARRDNQNSRRSRTQAVSFVMKGGEVYKQ